MEPIDCRWKLEERRVERLRNGDQIGQNNIRSKQTQKRRFAEGIIFN